MNFLKPIGGIVEVYHDSNSADFQGVPMKYVGTAPKIRGREPSFLAAGVPDTQQIYTLIRKRGRRRQNHRGVVNSVTARCVGLETCRLNMSYICLLTLTY